MEAHELAKLRSLSRDLEVGLSLVAAVCGDVDNDRTNCVASVRDLRWAAERVAESKRNLDDYLD